LKKGDYVTKLTKNIEIEASPEKVFALVLDTRKVSEFTKGDEKVEITSKGPFQLGTTVHMTSKSAGLKTELDMEVVEFERNRKLIMHTVGASKVSLKSWWILEPTMKGTILTHGGEYKIPYSILGKILDKLWVKRNMEKTIEKILEETKKALEP
jgi:ribosome-associated toxin RatA of RatAB toxin-antitoxin module